MQRLHPHRTWRGEPTAVYLTFDDGPHPQSTPALLDLLRTMGWQATFFVVGRQAEQFPEVFEHLRQSRMPIANHGYAHLHGWFTSTTRYVADYRRGRSIAASRLFRPPYGKLRPTQARRLRADGAQIVMWTVMPYDFSSRPASPSQWIPGLQPGDIIALHDTPQGLRYFQAIAPHLRAKLRQEGWTTGLLTE